MTLFEALELIGSDGYAENKSPAELAALVAPWLLKGERGVPYPPNAPFMIRQQWDDVRWNRFLLYSQGVMRQTAATHTLLRAASHLSEEDDLGTIHWIMLLAKKAARETVANWHLTACKPTR